MSQQASNDHQATIVEQFSQQAIPFAQVPGHLDSIQLLIELAEVKQTDNILDVACGPGLVACEFAAHCSHVTGIDITPAMIEQAQKRQTEKGLTNLRWSVGEALPLPYADNSFSLVITRYSYHHFLDPRAALAEMIRVCKPSGRVLVADVAIDPDKSAAYDLFYDHLLVKEWNRWFDEPFNEYLARCRAIIVQNREVLPERMQPLIPYIFEELLPSYGEVSGIGKALERMSRRVKRANPLTR